MRTLSGILLLVFAASAHAELALTDLKWDAPGPYHPGDLVKVHYRLDGVKRDEQGRVKVILLLQTFDPLGQAVVEPRGRKVLTEKPLASTLQARLPRFAPAGNYKFAVLVRDELAKTEKMLELPFVVVRDQPAKVFHGLEIPIVRYSKADGSPLDTLEFHAGAHVYRYIEIGGLTFKGNAVAGVVGIRLAAADGKVVSDRPQAVKFSTEIAYHPPTHYVYIDAHDKLPKDLKPGVYRETYTVTDGNSGKSVSYNAQISIK